MRIDTYSEADLGDAAATVVLGDVSDLEDVVTVVVVVVFLVYLALSRLSDDSRPSTSMSRANMLTEGSCRLTLTRRQRLITN